MIPTAISAKITTATIATTTTINVFGRPWLSDSPLFPGEGLGVRLDEVVVVDLGLLVVVLVGIGVEVVVILGVVIGGTGYGCGRMVMSAHLAGPKS